MHRRTVLMEACVAALLTLAVGCNDAKAKEGKMDLTSKAFEHEEPIPAKYSCEGEEVSPPLAWSAAPEGTKSFALIVEDPDAPDPKHPKMTWVHWVLYDIPADTASLAEAIAPKDLPEGTLEGLNSWKKTGYGGPCPPIGRHRYFFRLYALDAKLPGLKSPTNKELREAMDGHVLAKGELMGTYEKGQEK